MIKGISIVIPNYNGIELFPSTLPTIFEALAKSGFPAEIIVVDDCSTDGSVKWLHENYPSVKIIINKSNSGFSVSCNNGLDLATYDKVLFLNSDVKLTPDYFLHQVRYFSDEKTFGVMGRIVGWDDEKIQDGAKYPYFHGAKIKTSGNYILKNRALMNDGLYTVYLSGANCFIDKKKFLEIGGFNELFSPFYVEDYELSVRAWRFGYKCWFDYNSICRHKVSYTIKASNQKRRINAIYYRNKMFLHELHLTQFNKILWFTQITFECIFNLLMLRFYFVKAYFLYLFSLKKLDKKREEFIALCAKNNCRTLKEVMEFIKEQMPAEVEFF